MDLSLKTLTHLFAKPEEYAIDLMEDGMIQLRGAEIYRSNNYIDFTLSHLGVKYLITTPMTSGYLEHCSSLEAALKGGRSTLLTPYVFEKRRVVSRRALGGDLMVRMAIQELPKGILLTHYLDRADRGEIEVVYGAIDSLEEQCERLNIGFSKLNTDNIIIGDDGLLYPFRYGRLHFNTSRYCATGCDTLREMIAKRYGVARGAAVVIANSYKSRDLYDDYLSVGMPHEDRILVEAPTGFGFVDSNNCVVIPPNYIYASDFREGRAEVQSDTGYGLIDTDGEVVIPAIYASLGYNEETGITVARLNDKWAYFSYCGERLTEFVDEYPDETLRYSQIEKLA